MFDQPLSCRQVRASSTAGCGTVVSPVGARAPRPSDRIVLEAPRPRRRSVRFYMGVVIALIGCMGTACPFAPTEQPDPIEGDDNTLITSASGATFQGLGDIPGGGILSYATALSGNGQVVVGSSTTDGPNVGFRWENGIMTSLGPQAHPNALSRDGSVIAGTVYKPTEAFRWTGAEGVVRLGFLPNAPRPVSDAGAVSSDGLIIVGSGMGASLDAQAFHWSAAAGMVGLGDIPGTLLLNANSISADGSVILGYGLAGQHYFPFRWTAETGPIKLTDLPEFSGVDWQHVRLLADGSVTMFEWNDSADGYDLFRWTPVAGKTSLGHLAGLGAGATITGFSADGRVAVGSFEFHTIDVSAEVNYSFAESFVWDPDHGVRRLYDVLLRDVGLDVSGWALHAVALSDDGLSIAGNGVNPAGDGEAWIAHLPGWPATQAAHSISLLRVYFVPGTQLRINGEAIATGAGVPIAFPVGTEVILSIPTRPGCDTHVWWSGDVESDEPEVALTLDADKEVVVYYRQTNVWGGECGSILPFGN